MKPSDPELLQLLKSTNESPRTGPREVFPQLPAKGQLHVVVPPDAQAILKARTKNAAIVWLEQVADAIEAGASRVVVVADRWDDERAMLAELTTAGIEGLGLMSDLLPRELAEALAPWEPGGDRPSSEPVQVRYAIVGPARSGTSYLTQLLTDAGLGLPSELIHQQASTAARLGMGIEEILARASAWGSASGVFGVKMLATHFAAASLGDFSRARATAQALKDQGYVFFELTRNPVDVAVSSALARSLSIWNVAPDQADEARSRQMQAQIADAQLLAHLHAAIAHAAFVQRVFEVPAERRFSYSRLVSDPAAVVRAIGSALGRSVEPEVGPAQTARLGKDNPAYDQQRSRLLGLVLAEGMKGVGRIISHSQQMTGLPREELRQWSELPAQLNLVITAAQTMRAGR